MTLEQSFEYFELSSWKTDSGSEVVMSWMDQFMVLGELGPE